MPFSTWTWRRVTVQWNKNLLQCYFSIYSLKISSLTDLCLAICSSISCSWARSTSMKPHVTTSSSSSQSFWMWAGYCSSYFRSQRKKAWPRIRRMRWNCQSRSRMSLLWRKPMRGRGKLWRRRQRSRVRRSFWSSAPCFVISVSWGRMSSVLTMKNQKKAKVDFIGIDTWLDT